MWIWIGESVLQTMQCQLFHQWGDVCFFHSTNVDILPLFAVYDSSSNNVDKKWSSLEAVRGFKVKVRFPSKSVQRNSMRKSVQRNSTRDFQKVQWRPALLWLVRSRFDGSRFPSKSVWRTSMRKLQKVWWRPALLWLVKSRFDGRMRWPYFAHWEASPYTNIGIGALVLL